MNAELKDVILKCDVCNSYNPEQPKERLMPHEFPTRPWQKVGTDQMQFDGHQYLITVDYYSSFFEVDKLQSTDSRTAVEKLKCSSAVMEYQRWSNPTTVLSMIPVNFRSFQKSGFFSILSPLPATHKAKERWRVLLESAKAS